MRSDWYAPYLFDRLHIYQDVADADDLHNALYESYYGDGNLEETRFGKYERLHFADVARLLTWNTYALIASALALFVFSLKSKLRFIWMRIGALYVLAALVAVVLIATRWLMFFRGMHPLLFSHGHWDFHPNDLILQLYPEMLLAIVASVIVLMVLMFAVIIYWIGNRFDKDALFVNFHWEWKKRHGDIALVVGLFCVPIWLAGRQIIEPWGGAWLLYWFICLSIVIACFLALSLKNTATSALIIGATVVSMHAFAEGTASTTRYAQYILDVSGKRYIKTIDDYKKEHGAVPDSIETLLTFSETNNEQALVKQFGFFGPWKYEPRGKDNYIIYFKGPLAFEFSYHSRTQYWNAMRRP